MFSISYGLHSCIFSITLKTTLSGRMSNQISNYSCRLWKQLWSWILLIEAFLSYTFGIKLGAFFGGRGEVEGLLLSNRAISPQTSQFQHYTWSKECLTIVVRYRWNSRVCLNKLHASFLWISWNTTTNHVIESLHRLPFF